MNDFRILSSASSENFRSLHIKVRSIIYQHSFLCCMYGGNTTEIRLVMHVTVTNKLASFAYAFVPSCLRNNCLIRLLISSSIICKTSKVINNATLRSPFVTLLLTNKLYDAFRLLSTALFCGTSCRCAWRVRSRRFHTHATCERRSAKASSERVGRRRSCDISMKIQLQTMVK